MAVRDNQILTTDITTTAREIDFVTRFGRNWKALQDVLGIMEPIKKEPGTQLRAYKASIELEDGAVAEGDVIPLSGGKVKPVYFEDIAIKKYAKSVTLEDVAKYGANVAVQKTDEAFLNALQGKVMDDFYSFLTASEGRITGEAIDFKAAIAKAIGKVKASFESKNLDYGQVVVFVNLEDAYDYLGVADLSLQTLFGMTYVENFLGADRLIMSTKIPAGSVIATPVSNIDLYYIDPSDGEIGQLGLNYTVQGDTNLIGFHAEGNYGRAVGDVFALMGMKLWAEYLDGIAVITVDKPVEPTTDGIVTTPASIDALDVVYNGGPLIIGFENTTEGLHIEDRIIETDEEKPGFNINVDYPDDQHTSVVITAETSAEEGAIAVGDTMRVHGAIVLANSAGEIVTYTFRTIVSVVAGA